MNRTSQGSPGIRLWSALLLLIAMVVAGGCVSQRMYRKDSVVERSDYTLAFLEFDDHGEIWSPRQALALQTAIRRANENKLGAMVVLFAHGWNNNASPRNELKGTLAGFERTLHQVAGMVHEAAPERPVVGIYLGWRGKSLKGPFRYLSFFTRQRAATRVAGAQAMALLGQIILDTKQNPRSNLLVIGHSFGGQIVERLVQQTVAAGLFFVKEGPVPPSADLMVLLNPASPATNAKQIIDLLRWKRIHLERRSEDGQSWNVPLLVSLTSARDNTTRIAYHLASLIGLATNRFRNYGPEFCSPFANQRAFYTHTAGHLPVLHSHRVEVRPLQADQPALTLMENGLTVAGKDVSMIVTQRRGAYNNTPYWIMRVPSEIMANHNDTWNPNLLALLRGLFKSTGALTPGARLHVVMGPGDNPAILVPRSTETLWVVDGSRRVFAATENQPEPAMVGCIPEGIDLANVIGGGGGGASTLVIVQRHVSSTGDSRQGAEVLRIRLTPSGFRRVRETVLRSDERYLHAVVDWARQRVFLTSARELYVAAFGTPSAAPELLTQLGLAGTPAAVAFDRRRQTLLVLDDGSGSVVGYDLRTPSIERTVVARDIAVPSAMAIDQVRGDLYIIESGTGTILRWPRDQDGFADREVVARNPKLHQATLLQVTNDGAIWVADSAENKLAVFSTSGVVVQSLD